MARQKFEQAIPARCLRESCRIGQIIVENNDGKPIDKLTLSERIGQSPKSSSLLQLLASSIIYGIAKYDEENRIALTDLGQSYFYPQSEDERKKALLSLAQTPALLSQLYKHFNNKQLPNTDIAKNILKRTFKVADEKTTLLWSTFLDDAQFIGAIQQIKDKQYINISRVGIEQSSEKETNEGSAEEEEKREEKKGAPEEEKKVVPGLLPNQRAFITHGKNQEIVKQLKDLLAFGRFLPVVAEEHETTSKPVSEKVLEDMRSCFAGIIHVESEDELLDRAGNVHHKINENVLIEIGAALALYRGNFILLVQKGIHLPSNLQGLYRCEYEGSKLDYDATMKLLKAFSEFK